MKRLEKRLVDLGVLPRKRAASLIKAGRVTVDGEVVRKPATKVSDDVVLHLDGEPLVLPAVLLAYHKPVGVLSTHGDDWGRENLDTVLPPELKEQGYHAVGRLDRDTGGLLLLSRDGALTQRLLHPRRAVPRSYLCTVDGEVPDGLAEALAEGIATSEGVFSATVESVEGRRVVLTVTEGKYRMVRRIMANAGAPLQALHRLSYGAVHLGDLPEGHLREVDDAERAALRALVGR